MASKESLQLSCIDLYLKTMFFYASKQNTARLISSSDNHPWTYLQTYGNLVVCSLVSITVLLAQPSRFVNLNQTKERKKYTPPYHCQVMTLFEESLL